MDPQTESTQKKSIVGKVIWIFFLIAVLFFVSAVAAVVYNFLQGNVFIDAEKVDITFDGPEAVEVQEEIAVEIDIHNRNNATLRNVDLIVVYPDGARSVDDVTEEKDRERIDMEDMISGSRHGHEVEFMLVGDEGSSHELRLEMEFSVPDSNARLFKEAVHTITIGDAPVAISISPTSDVHSTNEAVFEVEVRSRSEEDLTDLVLVGEFPSDFEFSSADPEPDHDDNTWLFDIEEDELKTFEVRGVFLAEEGEERTMRFSAGAWDSVNQEPLGLFTHSARSVRMRAPHMSMEIDLNNVDSDGAVFSDETVTGGVNVRNSLDVPIEDVEVVLDIDGSVIDPDSIELKNDGFYDEQNSRLVWSHIDSDRLEELSRGRSEYLEFSFSLRESSDLRTMANPEESIRGTVTASQDRNDSISDRLRTTARKDLKVMTRAGVDAFGLYSVGPFSNTGPFPPEVGEDTTYTIVFSLTSTVNTIHNGRVTARLPEYVSWQDTVSPAEADVRYQSENRQVIWDIPAVEGGRGDSQSPLEMAFQVRYTPRPPHEDTFPVLLDSVEFRGTDSFVNKEVTATDSRVTTRVEEDPDFRSQDRVR